MDKQNWYGDDAFGDAAFIYSKCDSPILEILIEHQKKIGSIQQKMLDNALLNACSTNCLNKVQYLISEGANVNKSGIDKFNKRATPFITSIVQRKYEIAHYLVNNEQLSDSSFLFTTIDNRSLTAKYILVDDLERVSTLDTLSVLLIKNILLKLDSIQRG